MLGAKRSGARDRGQVLPFLALMFVAILAMAALVIDLGFLFGQRRFDQNGADAAALAAGRLLAASVSPRDNTIQVYFNVPEVEVYREARRFAGLDPANFSSAAPTGINQNPGLSQGNNLALTLEYSTAPGQWCYSPTANVQPPRTPAVPACVLPTADVAGVTVSFPPFPDPNYPYRIRVTVSSTTEHFLAQAVGFGTTAPAPASTDEEPACAQDRTGLGNSTGTTCAHAVVAVKGRATLEEAGPIVPVTTGDCQIAADSEGQLFQLWGSNPEGCGYNINPWKNMLDLSDGKHWCDDASGGSSGNPDFRFYGLLPPETSGFTVRTECVTGDDWDRDGFEPDSQDNLLTGQTDHDVPWLIARGFDGWIRASYTDGNKIPTFVDANPAQGANLGQNIAAGFYCGSSGVTPTSCDTTINPAGTYFFAKNQPGFKEECNDWYGPTFHVGCREAVVPAWGDDDDDPNNLGVDWAHQINTGGTGWIHNGGGGPNRVRIVRLLRMRLYCEYDNAGNCNSPPKSIVGNAANSDVWGQFFGPFEADYCPECIGTPTVYGNTAVLEK